MQDPYSPPSAKVVATTPERRFIAHSLVAFIAGVSVLPLALFGAVLLLVPGVPLRGGNPQFWASLVVGGSIAAVAVYRHKNIPLWLAATVGVLTASALVVAPFAWNEVLGAT